jgi:hypothetical protein
MFSDLLAIKLTLASGSDTLAIAGGDIESFKVSLHAWGFEARVVFHTWPERSTDSVFAKLNTTTVCKVTLSLAPTWNLPDAPPDPLVVTGILRRTSVVEDAVEAATGRPVRRRRYTIEFEDAAQVYWRQHFPSYLGADMSVSDLVNANLTDGIQLDPEATWATLGLEHPIVFVGLGAAPNEASFYDFVCWYVDTNDGTLTYDTSGNTYALLGAKATASGTPGTLLAKEVASAEVLAPDRARHDLRLLDATATAATATTTVTQVDSVTGLHRDVLALPSTSKALDDLKTVETGRLAARTPGPFLRVTFSRFPTITFRTGTFVSPIAGAGWSEQAWLTGRTFRVFDIELEGSSKEDPDSTVNQTTRRYEVEMRADLEVATDTARRLPSYRTPVYPIEVEGKIHAAGGQTGDRRYEITADEKTGISNYTVTVPLWNADIPAPCIPDRLPGHLWFPHWKDQRVLVELALHGARITRTLEHGAGLTQASQGDQTLLGFSSTSQTQVMHDYEGDGDEKKPVLLVSRTHQGDVQTVRMSPTSIKISVTTDTSQAPLVQTYDVTLQVEMAKGQLKTQIGGSIGDVTGQFSTAASGLGSQIGESTANVQGQLQSTTAEVSTKVTETKGKVDAMKSSLAGGAGPVIGAGQQAVADINAAIK